MWRLQLEAYVTRGRLQIPKESPNSWIFYCWILPSQVLLVGRPSFPNLSQWSRTSKGLPSYCPTIKAFQKLLALVVPSSLIPLLPPSAFHPSSRSSDRQMWWDHNIPCIIITFSNLSMKGCKLLAYFIFTTYNNGSLCSAELMAEQYRQLQPYYNSPSVLVAAGDDFAYADPKDLPTVYRVYSALFSYINSVPQFNMTVNFLAWIAIPFLLLRSNYLPTCMFCNCVHQLLQRLFATSRLIFWCSVRHRVDHCTSFSRYWYRLLYLHSFAISFNFLPLASTASCAKFRSSLPQSLKSLE